MNVSNDLFGNISYPFEGVRVYLSGKFTQPKELISDRLYDSGAIVKSVGPVSSTNYLGLSKDTCVVIAGGELSEQELLKLDTLRHDGFHIPVISENEMNEIINGNIKREFPAPIKNVDITYDFIFNSRTPMIQHFNFYGYTHSLGQKELFVHDLKGNKDCLLQSLGNIGAYSNFEFDPKSIDYCWLKNETINKLKKGEKDEFIQIITEKYNSSAANKFTYKFIIESEAVFWMLFRAKEIGDNVSLYYLNKYLQSIYE